MLNPKVLNAATVSRFALIAGAGALPVFSDLFQVRSSFWAKPVAADSHLSPKTECLQLR
jgi:hypothetical protein